MDTQPTIINEPKKRDVTFWQITVELLTEFFDPVSKYTYLFMRTFCSVLVKPRAVVVSIIFPPMQPANSEKLHVRMKRYWQSSRTEKIQRFHKWHRIDEFRKYYNPVSFLGASVALLLLLSSVFTVHRYTSLQSFDFAMRELFQVDTISINNPTIDKQDREAFWEMRNFVKESEKNAVDEVFRKSSIMVLTAFVSLLFAYTLHRIHDSIDSIELFILGLYLLSVSMLLNKFFELLIEVINYNYQFLTVFIFFVLFFIAPGMYYSYYINKSGKALKKSRFWLVVPAYAIILFFTSSFLMPFANRVYHNVSKAVKPHFPIKLAEEKLVKPTVAPDYLRKSTN